MPSTFVTRSTEAGSGQAAPANREIFEGGWHDIDGFLIDERVRREGGGGGKGEGCAYQKQY